MPGHRLALDAAQIADVAAAVDRGVGVERLGVATRPVHADAVAVLRHRREVDDEDERIQVSTLWAVSEPSIHSKPPGWKSSSCSAGSLVSSRLRSRTRSRSLICSSVKG